MTQQQATADDAQELGGQPCPMCHKNTLTLREDHREIPYFGNVFLFSMSCNECKYFKSDIELENEQEPCKFTLDIDSEDDMKIRVVKSAEATVKIPHIVTIEPGGAGQGFISNIEGIFNRVKRQIEHARDNAEEKEDRKKAKNLLKKIQKIMWGQQSQKIIIEDPSGNSAIISEKAKKEKLKVKKK